MSCIPSPPIIAIGSPPGRPSQFIFDLDPVRLRPSHSFPFSHAPGADPIPAPDTKSVIGFAPCVRIVNAATCGKSACRGRGASNRDTAGNRPSGRQRCYVQAASCVREGREPCLLDGIRVIEAATYIAGPAAAMILGEFGADVVKIEPPGGDPFRQSVGAPGNPPSASTTRSTWTTGTSASLVLDLKQETDRARLHALLREADIFITNAPPRRPRPAQASASSDLTPLNERLIYASVTAMARPGRRRRAPASTPQRSGPHRADGHGAPRARFTAGPLAARHGRPSDRDDPVRRRRHGALPPRAHGGKAASCPPISWPTACGGMRFRPAPCSAAPSTSGARRGRTPPTPSTISTVCRDGRWFHLVVLPEDRNWPKLAAALGKPEWLGDPRYRDRAARAANRHALIAELDALFAARDWPEWREILVRHAVSFGEIGTLADIPGRCADAGMRGAHSLRRPGDGRLARARAPLFLEGEARRKPRAAPALDSG